MAQANAARAISLGGEWTLRLDHQDAGIAQGWPALPWSAGIAPGDGNGLKPANVQLPGSLTENHQGDEVTLDTPWVGRVRDSSFFEDPRYEKYRKPGQIKVPFWLTPLKYYKGPAWYRHEIEIPVEWNGHRIQLHLERVHWTSQVWVDGEQHDFCDSLGAPHLHELGPLVPGRHVLDIRVDNRMHVNVGEDSNSMSDHSQSNWNGIVGAISLVAMPLVTLLDVQVFPADDRQSVRVVARIQNGTEAPLKGELHTEIRRDGAADVLAETGIAVEVGAGETMVEARVQLSSPAEPWGEFSPVLYHLHATFTAPERDASSEVSARFGFRNFEARGTRFFLNDRPIFLRGTVEDCIFPLTGYPPTDKAAWLRMMRILKEHGLNHMRCHSWCPPKAAFDAADEEGVILSVECGSWTDVGMDDRYDDWLYREAAAILRAYGNHPSFCMMLYGNEPFADRYPEFVDVASEFLGKFVTHLKNADGRHLYSGGTAWPQIPENDFHVWADPRIQLWDQNLDSRINARPPETITDYADFVAKYPVPVITHEPGQWCVYPNFDEIPEYSGVSRAYNFEIFRDFLVEAGMGDLSRDFLMASGRLQVLCYKEEIESQLRTPGLGGFQQLCLHDFSGQGTALVGVLDAFWNPKPYVTAEEYTEFCGPTVLLALMGKRVFSSDEEFHAQVKLSHFGADEIPQGEAAWKLTGDDGKEYSGKLRFDALETGGLHEIGEARQSLTSENEARRLTFEVALPTGLAKNRWDVWVYPKKLEIPQPDGVIVTDKLDGAAQAHLADGRSVLLLPPLDNIAGDKNGQVPPGFSSIFWNTAWTQGQQPHTLGILCDPNHPALAHFPTEYHSNWQWWHVITNSRSMILNPLDKQLQPIVRVIDDWFKARRLGLMFECKTGGGKLLVCSVDLLGRSGTEVDPVRRQFLFSLVSYMGGKNFAPEIELEVEALERVVIGQQ